MASSTVDLRNQTQPVPVEKRAGDEYRIDLLEQFYLTLGVTYQSIPSAERTAQPGIDATLQRLFASPHSWSRAYEIEQSLCYVMTEDQLNAESQRRLAEAKSLKLEYVDVISEQLKDQQITLSKKRDLFHRLLNDLQWFYLKRIQHRAASQRLLVRVSALFVLALVTMLAVLFIQFFSHPPATPSAAADASAAASSPASRTPETPGGGK